MFRRCPYQTRPHAVSEHWSKVLLEEWACQATFEQELDLPVTVVKVDVTNGARQQAQGQVNFIDIFTQPLFDTTAAVISGMFLSFFGFEVRLLTNLQLLEQSCTL